MRSAFEIHVNNPHSMPEAIVDYSKLQAEETVRAVLRDAQVAVKLYQRDIERLKTQGHSRSIHMNSLRNKLYYVDGIVYSLKWVLKEYYNLVYKHEEQL